MRKLLNRDERCPAPVHGEMGELTFRRVSYYLGHTFTTAKFIFQQHNF